MATAIDYYISSFEDLFVAVSTNFCCSLADYFSVMSLGAVAVHKSSEGSHEVSILVLVPNPDHASDPAVTGSTVDSAESKGDRCHSV